MVKTARAEPMRIQSTMPWTDITIWSIKLKGQHVSLGDKFYAKMSCWLYERSEVNTVNVYDYRENLHMTAPYIWVLVQLQPLGEPP